MTSTYEELLVEVLPSRIEDDAQYDAIRSRLGELLAKRKPTAAESKLMGLLSLLVEDFDRRNALPPDESTPAEILRFLVDQSEQGVDGLLPVFGQRSHAHEALNGTRKISATQARKLGKLFSVKAGLFV